MEVAEYGNCGFRVLSCFLHANENQYSDVRKRMWLEFHNKRKLYINYFTDIGRYHTIMNNCQHWSKLAPIDRSIDVSDHLFVIANKFNLCVVLISNRECSTVLPLHLADD